MELSLSLGDPPRAMTDDTTTCDSRNHSASADDGGRLGFCMALGIDSSNNNGIKEDSQPPSDQMAVPRASPVADGSDHHQLLDSKESALDRSEVHDPIRSTSALIDPPAQLDLLPLAPVPRHGLFPRFSDNGSSEEGSSEKAVKGEEASSPTSGASSFQIDLSLFVNMGGATAINKRKIVGDSEAAGNDGERASSRCSDEDDNGVGNRKKLRLSKEQSAFLEESFREHTTLNPKQKQAIAKQLNLMPRQVEVWFQNRRARTKLKQTEAESEYLRRCCEALREENRKLQKEVQELRAVKSSNPFNIQLPATTLTMCPSCERITTSAVAEADSVVQQKTIPMVSLSSSVRQPEPGPFPFPGGIRPTTTAYRPHHHQPSSAS